MKTKILTILLIIYSFVSCASDNSAVTNETQDFFDDAVSTVNVAFNIDQPLWLADMPFDENYYYGIGISENLDSAKERSIVDIGQQFSSQVKSVLLENVEEQNNQINSIITSIDKQLTNQVVYGAKFINQYQDKEGNYWIL